MKLAVRDIKPFLENPQKQSGGVLIYGPDHGQVRQRVDEVACKILTDLNDPFNRVDLDASQLLDDPAKLNDELSAMSFTGGVRLILVRDATDKLTDVVESALEALSPQCYLVVYADDLSAKSSLRALFEKEPKLASLPCYKDEGAGLQQFIRDTLRGYGLRCHEEVIAYLCDQLNGDRVQIINELDKLSLFLGEDAESVSLDEVMEVIGESNERTMDDVCEALAGGQIEKLCRALDRLEQENVASIAIVRSAHRYFARLMNIHEIMSRGANADMAMKQVYPPVFFKQVPIMKRHLERWRASDIPALLHRLHELETKLKRTSDIQQTLFSHELMLVAARAA